MNSIRTYSICAGLLCLLSVPSNSLADKNYTVSKGQIQKVSVDGKNLYCIAPSSKWLAAKKVSAKIYKALSKPTSAHKEACSDIIPKKSLKSLTQLPDASDLTSANSVADVGYISAVSGTPPLISEVPSMDSTQLFWRPGVVSSINSGSPAEQDCNEFWGSSVDGESAGQTACYMLQDVGQAIGNIQQAGTSLCYFKNVPNSNIFSSGAGRIVKGAAPSGGIKKLFDTPEGSSPRIIQIDTGDSSTKMFIRIASRSELDAAGNLYKFDLWDCSGSTITSRESGTVKLSGDYIASSYSSQEGRVYSGTVHGYLKYSGGDISFDNTRERTATSFGTGDQEQFASEITITADNQIITKQRGSSGSNVRAAYSVANYSGSSVSDLRFLSGAISMKFSGEFSNSFIGSSEYRDSFYAAAPSSTEATTVSAFSFDSDSYYSGEIASPSLSTRGLSCSPSVNIELELDMTSDAMTAIRQTCEGERLDGFDMCQSDSIQQAQTSFQTYCSVG